MVVRAHRGSGDFYEAFVDVYRAEWDRCSEDDCPIEPGATTTTGEVPCDCDEAAASSCPGFAYPEPPVECAVVCGSFTP